MPPASPIGPLCTPWNGTAARVEEVVILTVCVPRSWLKRHGGSVEGLWRSVQDIPPRCIRRVVTFGELSRSPALETVGR
jgi:hypothetical protein